MAVYPQQRIMAPRSVFGENIHVCWYSCGYIDLCVTGAVFSNNELGSINP